MAKKQPTTSPGDHPYYGRNLQHANEFISKSLHRFPGQWLPEGKPFFERWKIEAEIACSDYKNNSIVVFAQSSMKLKNHMTSLGKHTKPNINADALILAQACVPRFGWCHSITKHRKSRGGQMNGLGNEITNLPQENNERCPSN